MLNDGLKYSDSRMANEREFTENLSSFDLKSNEGSYKGGPILFRKENICSTAENNKKDRGVYSQKYCGEKIKNGSR